MRLLLSTLLPLGIFAGAVFENISPVKEISSALPEGLLSSSANVVASVMDLDFIDLQKSTRNQAVGTCGNSKKTFDFLPEAIQYSFAALKNPDLSEPEGKEFYNKIYKMYSWGFFPGLVPSALASPCIAYKTIHFKQ